MEVIWGLKLVDLLTIVALILGPVIAVIITLWRQNRDHAYKAKERLFMTLMSHRRSSPTAEWATALNLIDVTYADHPNILANWAVMYDLATQQQAGGQKWNHEYLLLLQNMAFALGYDHLKLTDIDRFYLPQNLGEHAANQAIAAAELIRVLKASKSFASDIESDEDLGL